MDRWEARASLGMFNVAYSLIKRVYPELARRMLEPELGFGEAIGRLSAVASGTLGDNAKILKECET